MADLNKKFNGPKSGQERLDIFLTEKLGITRSQAQKLIIQKLVTKNGQLPKKTGDLIKAGDKIVILNDVKTTVRAENFLPPPTTVASDPTIIAATPDYIIVEKPFGMLTHPTRANEKNTLVNFLLKKYPKIKKVGDDPKVRPGIVHRLDKEASGLLVVAKTQPMFEHLKEQFKNRTIEKEYFALVHGKVVKDWDEINFPIARSENVNRMAARPIQPTTTVGAIHESPLSEGEKPAKTEFLVEKRFANMTLLRVILHTGRMHQIRAHLLAYNHPLVGDPLYFHKKQKRKWDDRLGRLFLHSTKLAFTDLDGKKQTFDSPLPKELSDFLSNLN